MGRPIAYYRIAPCRSSQDWLTLQTEPQKQKRPNRATSVTDGADYKVDHDINETLAVNTEGVATNPEQIPETEYEEGEMGYLTSEIPDDEWVNGWVNDSVHLVSDMVQGDIR